VKALSVKGYQQLYKLNTLDFVLMFIPIDAAYALVAQEDTALWTQAYEKNVLIVTPLSMLPALRTVANIWRQQKHDRYALEIAQQGGELYDKFAALMEDLQLIRSRMRQTQNAFDQSLKKLQGRDNLIKKVEKIKELGAAASKQLPKNLLDWADTEQ
jgi:DNA recombination protein RmuC